MPAPFPRGSVLLVPEGKSPTGPSFRLHWRGQADGGSRSVPAGRYRVAHYSLEAERDGSSWILSVSGQGGRTVVIEPGKETALEIDPRIHVKARANPGKGGKLAVGLGVMGDGHQGLTVSRDGTLVNAAFVLLDEEGRELHRGPLAYG